VGDFGQNAKDGERPLKCIVDGSRWDLYQGAPHDIYLGFCDFINYLFIFYYNIFLRSYFTKKYC